jgi:hypothetical protein
MRPAGAAHLLRIILLGDDQENIILDIIGLSRMGTELMSISI